MARKKKKKTRAAATSDAVAADSVIAQLIENPNFRLLGQVLWRLGIVLGVVVLTYLSLEARREVRADPRFQLSNWDFQFGEFPAWVTPRIRGEIEEIRRNGIIGRGAAPGNIFQAGLLERVRERLEANPWIRRVESIDLRYPGIDTEGRTTRGGLNLALRLRRPIAAIHYGEAFYYTDEEGICLGGPVPPVELEDRAPVLPVIRGTERFQNLPAPTPGQNWLVSQVLEGIEVAYVLDRRRINRRFSRNPVITVDIANVGGVIRADDSEIQIIADRPGRDPIVLGWGRSPISPGARTVSLSQLLDKLEVILAEPHRFIGESRAQEVLLRLDLSGEGNFLQVRGTGYSPNETGTQL